MRLVLTVGAVWVVLLPFGVLAWAMFCRARARDTQEREQVRHQIIDHLRVDRKMTRQLFTRKPAATVEPLDWPTSQTERARRQLARLLK